MEVLLEDLVVSLAHLLDELLAVVLGLVEHVGRNLADDVVGAHGFIVVGNRLHADEVDNAEELVFGTDGELDGDGIRFELADDLIERPFEVCADAIHLVDEADARDTVFVGLAPDGLRLRLDASNRVEHGDRAVEHTERPFHFRGEVHVAGRIDDVDTVIAPEAGRGRGGDGDATLLFLLHPVHDSGPFVDLTNLVGDARIEEDALGRGGLAGIDVRHDADVARLC